MAMKIHRMLSFRNRVVIIVIGVRLIRRQKDAVNPEQEVPTDVE